MRNATHSQNRILQWMLCCAIFTALACGDNKEEKNKSTGAPQSVPSGNKEYQKIVKAAYNYKKNGENDMALTEFRKAIQLVDPESTIYASALDDQAAVLVRLGKYKEARKLFEQSLKILKKINGNPVLRRGVEERLETLGILEKRNIICGEPGMPDPALELPYYPIIPKYQRSLGQLTRKVAVCKDSNEIEAVNMRVVVTGDGRFVRADARDGFKGTEMEKCVAQKLEEWIPQIQLPRFAACFRGFSYPFMVGNHPAPETPNEEMDTAIEDGEAAAAVAIPAQNQQKGAMPDKASALTGAQKLLSSYVSGDDTDAMTYFFPADAFDVVKDSPNPSRYYAKLVGWYKEDIALERPRLQGEDWKVEDITFGNCKWKAPGTEANKVGYWSCNRNTVTVKSGDKQRRFEIQVLINWGENWYITHLRPVRN